MKTRFVQIIFAVCLVGVLLFALAPAATVQAVNPSIIPPNAAPPRYSYSKLAGMWWQWALKPPLSQSPVTDLTGERCADGQSGKVWFLAGTFFGEDPVTRTCTVPQDKILFFPVFNVVWSATEPDETARMARLAVKNYMDGAKPRFFSTEIDGVPITQTVNEWQPYRIYQPPSLKSLPIFDLTLDAENIFGLPAGTIGPASTDGYYLMVAPLSPGEHMVHIQVKDFEHPDKNFVNVTYKLTVK